MTKDSQATPDNIRWLRTRLGLSQTELAQRLGVSYASVNRWENGRTTPYGWAWQRLLALAADGEDRQGAASAGVPPRQTIPRIDFLSTAAEVRVALEAEWLAHGYLVNPTFATETSLIDPLPHQRMAVYDVMLPQPRLRFLLADDAGAGKTIMTGLYIREMLARQRLQRILIVPPAGLVGNWQQELQTLFRLSFRIVSGMDARQGNPFMGDASDHVIVSVDTLAGDAMQDRLWDPSVKPYDLVVFDEAHKLAADQEPDGSIRKTQRYKLAERLAGAHEDPENRLGWAARHLLLLTATPHMGKSYPYFALWHLLQPEALSTPEILDRYSPDQRSKHYIRRTKEEMVTFEGKRLYPTRESTTVTYPLSPLEQALYDRTTEYIKTSYNRAAVLNRSAARLAMSVFQRRLASSAYALLQSLERRWTKLDEYVARAEAHQLDILAEQRRQQTWSQDPFDVMTGDEESGDGGREQHEAAEDDALAALVATSLPELRQERREIEGLIALARQVLAEGDEAKFRRLRELVRDPRFHGEKLLVFTEHRDTLRYLTERLAALGYDGRLAQIHGGMPYQEREAEVRRFRTPGAQGGADALIATDAAGEGINLQFCWVMVNYDIPWNPARLEQRMGRIHRYKQQHDPVLIFNLVADNTREGRVLRTLLDKLEQIRKDLRSDKVFDVIGRQLAGLSLRDLLFDSLDEATIERELGEHLSTERAEAAIHAMDMVLPPAGDVMAHLPAERERLQREAYQRLLPGYVRQFLEHSGPLMGIGWDGDLAGVFSLKPLQTGGLDALWPLMERYPAERRNRWTLVKPSAQVDATYFHPGEPVFDAYRAWATGRYSEAARRGGVFVDPEAETAYVLHLAIAQIVENDGGSMDDRAVATRLVAVREWPDGRVEDVPVERFWLLQPGPRIPVEWVSLAARGEVGRERAAQALRKALHDTWLEPLRGETDRQAEDEWAWVEAGYQALEAELAIRRGQLTKRIREGERNLEGLLAPVKRRQATLDDEKRASRERLFGRASRLQLAALEFIGHALVVPSDQASVREQFTADIERVAMEVTWGLLEEQGFRVSDVSTPSKAEAVGFTSWPGFDLWARHPDGRERAVEVKGRAGRGEVLVSDNEWAKACTLRDRYWLYVVWDCGSAHPYAIPIADPFGRLLARSRGGVLIPESEIAQAASTGDAT